jgi:serine/threonine protein kinase
MMPPAAKTTPRLPATIGRYRILARLGRGAMGVVYSAVDDQLERAVALKVMMADLESDPETRARFDREAQITGKLLHRNIITVFELGEEDGRLYLVMELLNGCTLAEFMKNGELPSLEQKLDLMIQTCEGLSSAHAKDIIHRDIKPSNLFVQADGGLKILDFGIARLASSSMTVSGMIMGTPDYMSPEQAQGKDVDARSDVFSAAGVFYFMLTGRRPFEAAALPGVLLKVVREEPPPIRANEGPAGLAKIIAKGMQKDPAHRYQRCGDMGADLVRFKRQFDADVPRRREHEAGHAQAPQPPAEARAWLATGAVLDPDDTVQFSPQNGVELDPAATVVMTPVVTSIPDAPETWASKLRRRLHMVRKPKAQASPKTPSISTR